MELRARIIADGVDEEAYYLDENLELLARIGIIDGSYRKDRIVDEPERFRRGDVNADGDINVTDAVALLDYLFLSGTAPPCRKAADSLDDGTVNLSDAVGILISLFGGRGPLAEPFEACGSDPTVDDLGCGSQATTCDDL